MYYTYAYLREDRTPYYIGKGSANRAYQNHKRTNGQNLLPKNKDQILILKNFEIEDLAYKHEQYLIALYGRKCDGGIFPTKSPERFSYWTFKKYSFGKFFG